MSVESEYMKSLTPEQREIIRAKQREYQKRSREKFKATATPEQKAVKAAKQREYTRRSREKFKATATPEQKAEHKAKKAAYMREYYKKHREKFLEYKLRYYQRLLMEPPSAVDLIQKQIIELIDQGKDEDAAYFMEILEALKKK